MTVRFPRAFYKEETALTAPLHLLARHLKLRIAALLQGDWHHFLLRSSRFGGIDR
jgi:hypothetical protein